MATRILIVDDDVDRILGLEIGADDDLPKPFDAHELLARMHAVLRRLQRSQGQADSRVIEVGNVVLDAGARTVFRGGRGEPAGCRHRHPVRLPAGDPW